MLRSRTVFGLFVGAVCTPFRTILAQTTHTVTVGADGSFYNPPTTSAGINDTVNFVFDGLAHSVVQASFENPCFPAQGGFSSGLVQRVNLSGPAPIWTLKITNVTSGIWFYCGSTFPVSHCASGMVGAINPPSMETYSQFLAAAKLVTTVGPPVTVALSGQSAFATAAPQDPLSQATVSPTSVPTLESSTSSSSTAPSSISSLSLITPPPSVTPTESSSLSTSSSHNGAIIGGSVAGGLVFLALLAFLICFLLRTTDRSERRGSKDFFRYRAQTPILGAATDAFNPSRFVSSSNDRARQRLLFTSAQSTPMSAPPPLSPEPVPYHPYRNATPEMNAVVSPQVPSSSAAPTSSSPARPKVPITHTTPRSPPRPPRPSPAPVLSLPVALFPPQVDHKPPLSTGTTSVGAEDRPNVHVLAREVTSALLHARGSGGTFSSDNSLNPNRRESTAPPRYRATIL